MNYLIAAVMAALLTCSALFYINNQSLRGQVADLQASVETKQGEIRELESERDRLSGELGRRGEIIESLTVFFSEYDSASAKKAQEIAEAVARVEASVRVNNARSTRILAELPQTQDMCAEANRLINQYLMEVYGASSPQ